MSGFGWRRKKDQRRRDKPLFALRSEEGPSRWHGPRKNRSWVLHICPVPR